MPGIHSSVAGRLEKVIDNFPGGRATIQNPQYNWELAKQMSICWLTRSLAQWNRMLSRVLQ